MIIAATFELTGFYGAQRSKNPVQRFVLRTIYETHAISKIRFQKRVQMLIIVCRLIVINKYILSSYDDQERSVDKVR